MNAFAINARALFRAMGFYALSTAFGKGLTLITLPYLTRMMPVEEYVRLDMAASLVEPVGLIGAAALGEALFRFGGSDQAQRIAMLGRLLALAMTGAVLLLLATQILIVPLLIGTAVNLPGELALRAVLASACLCALIELPLAYARFMDRPALFAGFTILRSLGQAALLFILLGQGYGVDALLIGNAIFDGLIVIALLVSLPRAVWQRLTFSQVKGVLSYCGPLLIGALAMFALGAADRWFLAGKVEPAHIAHYAIAAKLALALALVIQPVGLWWYPRRLRILAQVDGIARTVKFWLIGLVIIASGSLVVMIMARLLVLYLLPDSYRGALTMLPFCLAIVMLNELASLSNGVSYGRSSGWSVLGINLAGAMIALAGYLLLIPQFGLYGAITATIAGQVVRIGLFLSVPYQGRRMPYPVFRGAMVMAMAIGGMIILGEDGLLPAMLLP